MPLLFVYGTLKHGFPNAHVNAGIRRPGRFRTRECLPMYLLGHGHVPCVVLSPGMGHQIHGEVYEVDDAALAVMDKLERIGDEAIGYLRLEIDVEPIDNDTAGTETAFIYTKLPERIPSDEARIGPLPEYTLAHTALFQWTGVD
jgi:gamma-glutamylaminecyclotransferase